MKFFKGISKNKRLQKIGGGVCPPAPFLKSASALLLTDVFENFRNKCTEIYELDLAHFLSVPGLAWQVCLKKTRIRLELLTDIGMLLMVENGTRDGICHAIHS